MEVFGESFGNPVEVGAVASLLECTQATERLDAATQLHGQFLEGGVWFGEVLDIGVDDVQSLPELLLQHISRSLVGMGRRGQVAAPFYQLQGVASAVLDEEGEAA